MNVTILLASLVVLVGATLAWRFCRWRWRPLLVVDATPRRERGRSNGSHSVGHVALEWLLRVSNEGSATAKRSRAQLLRLQVDDDGAWRRFEPDPEACPMTWSDESRERNLAPGESADLVVLRGNGLPPGRYRFEVAVIDGEESRAEFELGVGEPNHMERESSAR